MNTKIDFNRSRHQIKTPVSDDPLKDKMKCGKEASLAEDDAIDCNEPCELKKYPQLSQKQNEANKPNVEMVDDLWKTCVKISNLPSSTLYGHLKRLIKPFGPICTFYWNKEKHYAFVSFSSVDDARAAIAKLNGSVFNNQALKVDQLRPWTKKPEETSLVVYRDVRAKKEIPSVPAPKTKLKPRSQRRQATNQNETSVIPSKLHSSIYLIVIRHLLSSDILARNLSELIEPFGQIEKICTMKFRQCSVFVRLKNDVDGHTIIAELANRYDYRAVIVKMNWSKFEHGTKFTSGKNEPQMSFFPPTPRNNFKELAKSFGQIQEHAAKSFSQKQGFLFLLSQKKTTKLGPTMSKFAEVDWSSKSTRKKMTCITYWINNDIDVYY